MSDLFESDFGTAFYRSRDPIKNFQINVQLEKVTSANIVPSGVGDNEKDGGPVEMQDIQKKKWGGQRDSEQFSFRWQEKVLSKREMAFYSKPENCVTVLDRKYHDDAEKILQKGNKLGRVFSYVDHDSFTKRDDSVQNMTTSPDEQPTIMAEKMSNLRHRRGGGNKFRDIGRLSKMNVVNYDPSEDVKRQNHLLSTPVQTMYIMADLTGEGKESGEADEFVLCTVKFDTNGVISIRPDFNKGRKPYKIEAAGIGRDLYEYTIEHASAQLTRQEQEKESKMLRELYSRHAEFLQACVGHDFEMPPTSSLRVAVFGEIESAKNFENDDLYISYFLDLPNGWHSAGSQPLSGVTQTCSTKYVGKEDVAYFSFPFSFELFYKNDSRQDDQDTGLRWPQLYLEVCSLDSWQRHRTEGYGYLLLPSTAGTTKLQINCWRPQGRSCVSDLRRFFIGGSPELEDPTYTAVPSTFDGKFLSKFGFRTISTGVVTLKLNVMQQSQTFLQNQTSKKKVGTIIDRLGKSSNQVNIMNVLEAFQRAKQRMIYARENLKKEYIETLKALDVEEDAQDQ